MQSTSHPLSLADRVQAKITGLQTLAHEIPGVVIVHNNTDHSVEYMSPRGLELLGIELEELRSLGPAYHEKFFNLEEAKEYVPKIFGLLERNDPEEWITFFQQVRHVGASDWTWYASSTKILLQDDSGKPYLSLTIALPLDTIHHNTSKIDRLQKENEFLRKNVHRFSRLTDREREVLKLTCLGKSSVEIAEALFISTATADTHRKNIKKKLGAENSFELTQYAMAFDLI